ncbi:hypothetical protein F8153_14405 [Alkaliphilus serpentinus]|uniref:Integron-associated effector binding protein domain-containing protein n=1 Tax=Alkaliphilus serpentinus TaxID=1482731 RepID=A0A833HLI4_9FIRM|nr:hypothetical protein F8153_14405 [Alkaliphilus serpentinus]
MHKPDIVNLSKTYIAGFEWGKYAVFKINGSVETAQNTWRYIYGTWLPNSNYEREEGPDFEVTDVCKSVYPGNMSMEIYIPIK